MLGFLIALQFIGLAMAAASDSCYHIPLHSAPASAAKRPTPWGNPTIHLANGSTCCSSLDEVRAHLEATDKQLLHLLSTRASYTREEARFKSTLPYIKDPSQNKHVIQDIVKAAPSAGVPQIIAQEVYGSLFNSSVLFEECIFNTYYTKGGAQRLPNSAASD